MASNPERMDVRHGLIKRMIRAALHLLGGVVLFLAGPALAHEEQAPPLASTCHAYAENPIEAQALRRGVGDWICADQDWRADTRHALLRFELGEQGRVPAQLVTRLARFEAMQIDIEGEDGTVTRHLLSSADFSPLGHMQQAANLPEAGTKARQITIEVIGPTITSLLSMARLHAQPLPDLGAEQIWIAMLCGLLLVPLFFNLALYRVLRDRFLLWHIAVVGFLLTHSLVSSGLMPLLARVPVGTLSMAIALTFCGGAAAAIMMASEFIEPDKLDPRLRKGLRWAALWLVFNAAFFAATIDWLQQRGIEVYFFNWSLVVLVAAFTIVSALRRGSRAIKFLVASWLPLIITGLWQIGISFWGDNSEPMSLFVAQRFAIAAEVLITSIGIADRFIQLRRDHDNHQLRASELARLALRDPLTGLLNRRAVESSFQSLRAEGFSTLAALDLDHFKEVNDRFGHTVGDLVLQAVAASFPVTDDVVAVRMGGEEFLLLLRGKDQAQRAERIRQAITARVSRDVPGLEAPLTASMGLVEIPAQVMPEAGFAAIYARADGLLYQAKSSGRNRMVSERMTVFAAHRTGNGNSAAA